MTAKKKKALSFEQGMDMLDTMISKMNEGGMTLEESMRAYEEGIELAAQLQQMLADHQRRIEQIDPDTGEISAFEEKEHGL